MGDSERESWAWVLELLLLQLLMMKKIRAMSSSVSRTPAKKAKIKCSFLGMEQEEGAGLVTGVVVETVLVLGLAVEGEDPMLSSPFQKNFSQKMQLSKTKLASLPRLFQKW